MLSTIDAFVIEKMTGVAQFFNDWLGWSQKTQERILLGLYILTGVWLLFLYQVLHTCALIVLTGNMGCGWSVLCDYNLPKSIRQARRLSTFHLVFRLLYLSFWVIVVGLEVVKAYLHILTQDSVGMACAITIQLLMTYMVILNVDGSRVGSVKLSLDKLTELFGRGWSTEPLGGNA